MQTWTSAPIYFILLGFLYFETTHANVQCPYPEDAFRPIQRLKNALFCTYDLQERPVRNRTANITVSVSLDIQHITLSDTPASGNTLMTWVSVVWKDEYLTWNSSQYEKIEQIQVPASQLWLPDVTIYNSKDTYEPSLVKRGTMNCIVNHWGRVLCLPRVLAPMHCVHDAQRWPYDTQNCQVNIGAWLYHGGQIDLQLYYEGYTLFDYTRNPEWELESVNVKKIAKVYPCCPDEPFTAMSYHVTLRRNAALRAATTVVPAFGESWHQ